MSLSSISSNKLTLLRKLHQKKYREREQLFFVEGFRSVRQVIENGVIEVQELYFDESQSLWQHHFWKEKVGQGSASLVNENDFADISDTDSPQGILALCKMPPQIAFEALVQRDGIILATDRIQDPGNLGTMIRTAAWFGTKGILVGKGTVDLFHPKVVRSTAGSTGSIPFQTVNLKEVLPKFEEAGWEVALLDVAKNSDDIRNAVHSKRTVLVVGNEANGINKDLFVPGRRAIHILSKSDRKNVESLNVAVATAVALYEFS